MARIRDHEFNDDKDDTQCRHCGNTRRLVASLSRLCIWRNISDNMVEVKDRPPRVLAHEAWDEIRDRVGFIRDYEQRLCFRANGRATSECWCYGALGKGQNIPCSQACGDAAKSGTGESITGKKRVIKTGLNGPYEDWE